MTAVGRSRLLVLLVVLLAAVVLGGPAHAQTNTTAPPVTNVTSTPSTTAATAGDAASTRTVNRIVIVLIAFAVVLVGMAIWFWRATKPLARHLDGLDLMGTRRWREGGSSQRATLLAPVHERRAASRDEESLPEPGPVIVATEPVAEATEDEAEEEPTPRAS
jgi:flagellar basal body-associated protein FliL